MNVLIALPWAQQIGGVTHVAASLAQSLESGGHRAIFLFPSEDVFRIRSALSPRGFPSVYCRLRNFPPPSSSWRARLSWYSTVITTLPQLIRFAAAEGIDVINVHYPSDGLTLLVDLAQRLRIPLVVSAHGSDLLSDEAPAMGLLRQLDSADAVVVPSNDYLRSVVEIYPRLLGKIHCIYNGYDEKELASVGEQSAEPSAQYVTIVSIGTLIPKKGIDVLLHALRRCSSSRLKLRVIGDGPLRGELESLAITLGVGDRVVFLGKKNRSATFDEIARCDLLVMPSRHRSESFGLAALEAMALAKPVVASAVGGLTELVDDGRTGFLVPREDPVALAQALDRLATNRGLRLVLGAAGRSKAARFTVRATGDAYESLFERLMSSAPRHR
jgi:glycosyltransferase involved in cell wall biosynthesis